MKVTDRIKTGLLLVALSHCMNLSATPVEVSAPRDAIPPNIVTTANKPMVMLAASKEHLLFGPIYNDFEDLDGDGVIDTTFKPAFEYYGYFDASKCYSYDNASGQFNPSALAIESPVTVNTTTPTRYHCARDRDQRYWSGNFLNWATMTRLDTVRKMLYGGYRAIDSVGSTVLMGSRLTWDAHSFVKYYRGEDINDYTPFSTEDLKKDSGDNRGRYAGLSICVTGTRDEASNTADRGAQPPVMRLVRGNVRFWSTVEWLACRWRDAPDNYSDGSFGPKLARAYLFCTEHRKWRGHARSKHSVKNRGWCHLFRHRSRVEGSGQGV